MPRKTVAARVVRSQRLAVGVKANFLTQSDRVDLWSAVRVAQAAGVATAPDSSTNGARVTANGGAGTHYAMLSTAAFVDARGGSYVTVSAFVKYDGTATWAAVGDDQHSSFYFAWVNLLTGAVGAVDANVQAAVDVLPSGWLRVKVTFQIPFGETVNPTKAGCCVGPAPAAGTRSFSPAGETVLAWGGQVVRSNYAGEFTSTTGGVVSAAMRLRASGRVPQQLAAMTDLPGCDWWLRADSLVTLNGSDVSAWGDKTASGWNAIQATPAQQPLFVSSSSNGQPALRGHLAASKMDVAGMSAPVSMTLFLVITKSTNSSTYFVSNAGGGNFGIIQNFAGSAIEWFNGGGSDRLVFETNPTAGPHILTVTQFNGTFLFGYYDGLRVFFKVPTANIAAIASIFNVNSSIINGSNGDIAEVARFGRVLGLGELQAANAYLANRYGVTLKG